MLSYGLLVMCVSTSASCCSVDPTIPPWFKLGVSTSSYQIEGAWNVSDKGLSIYDTFTHNNPGAIVDNSTGDVACDSYHLWRRDVEMAAEMGLDFYRFSMSWPRLLPKGFDNYISKDGANYYDNLINGLLEYGIQPVVTLYHWDLPEILQQLGGWTNPLIADWFADYARVVYSLYGDRVKTWITINEPLMICDLPYMSGMLAPRIFEPDFAPFLCTKNLLLAHAKAWRVYDEEFKPKYGGRVTIANYVAWLEATSTGDEQLAELVRKYVVGRFFHSIYSKGGGWDAGFEESVAALSKKMGFPRSRLPPFTDYERKLVRGTYDFMGFNYYTAALIRPAHVGDKISLHLPFAGLSDLDVTIERPPNATYGFLPTTPIYPEGLRNVMKWLKKSYGDIEMTITENGLSSTGDNLNDQDRILYIRNHLEQILLAIKNDHVRVTAYTYWSLMDNFEWMHGYRANHGLYQVNFTDPLRARTPRASSKYFSSLIKNKMLDICH